MARAITLFPSKLHTLPLSLPALHCLMLGKGNCLYNSVPSMDWNEVVLLMQMIPCIQSPRNLHSIWARARGVVDICRAGQHALLQKESLYIAWKRFSLCCLLHPLQHETKLSQYSTTSQMMKKRFGAVIPRQYFLERYQILAARGDYDDPSRYYRQNRARGLQMLREKYHKWSRFIFAGPIFKAYRSI